ncbi:leucine-rich repeat flightless-interacting protein 2 isoform X1 [Drosophila tropicalis]|uniref:leucine-rich repeat flightless-interacting protein 2 isoform X1 n=1 Tax=Drosophila tropicalis TaxID=46794 RepID=UPI0035ABC6CF
MEAIELDDQIINNKEDRTTIMPPTPTTTEPCLIDDGDSDDHDDEKLSGGDDESESEEEVLVQFLGEANRIAEARLAARRQARAEAREIRMRELERQQKEQEQNADRVFDMQNTSGAGGDTISTHPARLVYGGGLLNVTRATASRRSSEDSLEDESRSLRDMKHELKDVEERFRKAMITNAQLDNDRASQTYEVKLLKDRSETMQESLAQLQREYKEKMREYNALKRNLDRTTLELQLVQGQLNERDSLIAEQGLVIVAIENSDGSDAKRALVSVDNANVLASVQGSLDVRLKKFSEDKQLLLAEVQKLNEQLEEYKSDGKIGHGSSSYGTFGYDDDYEAQREANKIISDYKYKLQKAEQEIASLQASLARSETQVIRYKSTAEAAEKAEAELKVERRKLQRENRENLERLEEAETANNHLLKRLDKLKNAKSAILKDL